MMLIPCIRCGPRDEHEFLCGGTSHIVRPDLAQSDQVWGEYLFFRDNPKGLHRERWRHVHGCGLWFNLVRNTVTHEIHAVYAITEAGPGDIASGDAPPTGSVRANATLIDPVRADVNSIDPVCANATLIDPVRADATLIDPVHADATPIDPSGTTLADIEATAAGRVGSI